MIAGGEFVRYTSEILKVKAVLNTGVIMRLPDDHCKDIALDGLDVWSMNTMLYSFSEIQHIGEVS